MSGKLVPRGQCPYCHEWDRRLCDCLVGRPDRQAELVGDRGFRCGGCDAHLIDDGASEVVIRQRHGCPDTGEGWAGLDARFGAIPICGVTEFQCRCGLTPGHDGPHVCHDEGSCDGSWDYESDGSFKVIRFPRGGGLAELMGLR